MTNIDTPKRRSYAHAFYGIVSIVCPYLALVMMSLYQRAVFKDFNPSYGPLDVIFEQIYSVGFGAIVGLVFAAFSLKRRAKIISFGTAGILVNATIVLFLIVMYFRGQL